MDLRPPPPATRPGRPGRPATVLLGGIAAGVVVLLGLSIADRIAPGGAVDTADEFARLREVASRLRSAGAFDESAALYEDWLERAAAPAEERARVAFTLAGDLMDAGRHDEALRWLYEAESLGPGPLADAVGRAVVECLERLGRTHAAIAALGARTALGDSGPAPPGGGANAGVEADPVVARIGEREIRRSEVERALDELPPELARNFSAPEQRRNLLRKYVVDELLWRKAVRLGYDEDPDVLRGVEAAARQLAVARYLDSELASRAGLGAAGQVNETDLRNHFEANRERFVPKGEEGAGTRFEDVSDAVGHDYARVRFQAAYERMLAAELSAAGVELYPEAMVRPAGGGE